MKYRDLTSNDITKLKAKGILNGCGPEAWKGKGPNWLFRASCYQHDYNYAVGGDEGDRRWSDWGFYSAMVKDTKRLPWWRRPGARINAWFFYQIVRWFGKKHFYYGKKKTIGELLSQEPG